MDNIVSFEVDVSLEDCNKFAEISGDWNPLHTNFEYSRATNYGQQILHGAYSAGLVSRLAGMYLPGQLCILHGLRLKFLAPIKPPVRLKVSGALRYQINQIGFVDVTISDLLNGVVYVSGSYDFGMHDASIDKGSPNEEMLSSGPVGTTLDDSPGKYLVVGSSGAIGKRLMSIMGDQAIGVSHYDIENADDQESFLRRVFEGLPPKILGIIHVGWPKPVSQSLIEIPNPRQQIEVGIAGPLLQIKYLANLLSNYGALDSMLILISSTYASRGRHYYKYPIYSLGKAMIPCLVEILSFELGGRKRKCVGIEFDVLDGGMSGAMNPVTIQSHADRSSWGQIGTTNEAANQIMWVLQNDSFLINGSLIRLTSGAIP